MKAPAAIHISPPSEGVASHTRRLGLAWHCIVNNGLERTAVLNFRK